MPSNLLTAIVNDRTRSVNFFNGRLLTGEDLTAEQKANRVAHSLLGQAVGSGVAYGLEVSESATLSTVASPVLSIKPGLAINPNGGTLLLDNDTDISLVRPASKTNGGTSVFQECLPMQSGVYIAGAGVYLLTVGPASATQGLAEVSGVNTGAAPCNSKYKADGVQFRLVQIDLSQAELGDVNHLRNLVAYKCFGVADWAANITDPFGTPPGGHGLIDQLRTAQTITGCEVPLAVLYWTATGGLVFIDMWAVRRRLTRIDSGNTWSLFVNDRAISESEAAFLQFQSQIDQILASGGSPQSIKVRNNFRFLPPAGILPVSGGSFPGLDYLQFFSSITLRKPVFIEGARVEMVLRQSLTYRPIDLNDGELIWLYLVRQNRQPQQGALAKPYMIFVTGHAPYYGDAHYNVARWDYSNYF